MKYESTAADEEKIYGVHMNKLEVYSYRDTYCDINKQKFIFTDTHKTGISAI